MFNFPAYFLFGR